MKVLCKAVLYLFLFVLFLTIAQAQTSPNLENGFKNYGSYDGSHMDTVNLMTGGLIFHAPLLPDYPQRGKITPHYNLYMSSKNWQVKCIPNTQSPTGQSCYWSSGGTGVALQTSVGMLVQRTLDITSGDQNNVVTYTAFGYSLTSPDGSTHQLYPVPGHLDANGESTVFESLDTSGYHLSLNSDGTFSVLDRQGNLSTGLFGGAHCGKPAWNTLPGPASRGAPVFDTSPYGDKYCPQGGFATLVSDSNGNQMSLHGPLNANPSVDTLGKNFPVQAAVGSPDYGKCVSALPIAVAYLSSYIAPDGTTGTLETCYAYIGISTAFSQAGVSQVPNSFDPNSAQQLQLVTAIMADQTKWTFTYDSYGEVASVGLPSGGSISYSWTEINFSSCPSGPVSGRAIATRILNDGQGHSYTWHYFWGNSSPTALTNYVTDPAGNDTVHTFTALDNLNGGPNGCSFYETTTKYFQGSQTSGQLLKRVDTQFSSAILPADATVSASSTGNVVPTSITTTVYPSGKVSMITKQYDAGLGANAPIFGNVTIEKQYDWGVGAPGPLLRETDTTYQWQVNSAYLAAHMLDLPAKVIIKDGSSCALAETDYAYDEAAYLATPSPAISTQHGAPPSGVRGNQTTVTRWLAPSGSCNPTGGTAITSHTKWFDTGEIAQEIDPLGHTTTHTYDPADAGAYRTQTCNALNQCVSAAYDFQTGALTSFTDQNNQTSNYGYDYMFHLGSALAPPDPANGNARASTSFSYSSISSPGVLPLTIARQRSVTNTLTDSATNSFDGLGRLYKGQHTLPNGTATVDTTFDANARVATVTNPYFATTEPTYGITQTIYDGLDRPTQINEQDGSAKSVAYNVLTGAHDAVPGANALGDCTDSSDEAGNKRRNCSDALGRLVEVDEPNSASPATIAAGWVSISGSEQSSGQSGVAGRGSVTVSGTEGWACGNISCSIHINDQGSVSLTVNGHTDTATYGGGDNASSVANRLAGIIRANSPYVDYTSIVVNSSSSVTINLVARTVGATTDYALSATSGGNNDPPSFSATASGASLTGGLDSTLSPDSGVITLTLNGTAYQTTFGGGDTSSSIASRLASAISAGSWANASVSGGTITLTSKSAGSAFNYSLAASYTWNSASFPQPSFSTSASGTALSGGYDSGSLDNQPYTTRYSYDALGNLLRVDQKGTAPNDSSQWRTRTFTYDSLSRLLTATNPESGTITYTYDNDGNLLQKTSPAPNQTGTATQTVSFCYDELHRVTKRDYQPHTYSPPACPISAPVVSYTYDSGANAIGKLVSLLDQAGTATYSYDILGRLISETRSLLGANNAAISKTVSYEYNLDGSLKTLHYPSGAAVTYTPDSAGRVLSVVDSGSNINYVTGATYGPDSALTGFISGSGGPAAITNSFSYNKRLQPLTMSAATPSQTVFSIGYDFRAGNGTAGSGADNGNVYGIYNYRERTRDQSFTYDPLNRVSSAQNAGTDCTKTTVNGKTEYWGNSYSYDAWGNLVQKNITKCGAENLVVTADAHNWIHATGTPDYLYDAAGNMTFNATPPTQTYTYDQENRLTGAAGYTYTYDGDGNRVRKSNGDLAANGTLYWYMTPGVVAESDLAGTLKSEYVFFDGERVARRDNPGSPTATVAYYFSDHLKTASVITDAAGTIKAESDYYPWGGELQFVNNDSNDYKFTGKKRDLETGLDYFGARYYSNGLGRWISADWSATPIPVPYADYVDPQSLNLYAYVRNLPTTSVDADGHVDGGATAVLTAVAACAASAPCAGTVAAGVVSAPLSAPSVLAMTLAVAIPPTQAPDGYMGDIGGTFYYPPPPVSNPAPGTQTQVGPYDVGSAADLKGGSVVGDGLDVHHVPQQQPAGQVIGGYDGKTAPAIAVPKPEHQTIPTDKGQATRGPRDQLAKDVRDLRNKTKAPNSKIKELIKKNKQKYPDMNKPKPQPKPKKSNS